MKILTFTHIISYLLVGVLLACTSCSANAGKKEDNTGAEIGVDYPISYAQGFSVSKYNDFTKVVVKNPWDSTQLLQTYILVDKDKTLPGNLPDGIVIRTPISDIIATSTLQASILKELQSIAIIKGICEPQYVDIEEVKNGLASGKITDLGVAGNLDIEKAIILNPEAILMSPINGQSYGRVAKLGIPIIEIPDYTEPHPLGRTEWIRFYSLFTGKEELADSLFATITTKYNEIKSLTASVTSRRTIFNDKKYQSAWNTPGGRSNTAQIISDAGGKYVWADDKSTTSLPLSFEDVLDKAGDADTWIIRYYANTDMTYENLKKEYKPYSYFKAFKDKQIWGCNTMHSNYYEDLPIHPDLILKDFAYILCPDLFPEYTPRYFKPLE